MKGNGSCRNLDLFYTTVIKCNFYASNSRENLEIDCFLQLAGILDQLEHFLLPLVVSRHLGDVLSEHISALVPKKTPEILYQRLTEENQPLLATVLEVNVEVVLLDA